MATSYKKRQQFAKDGKTMQIISVNADGTATYAEVDKRTGKLKQGFQGNLPALGNKGGGSSTSPLMDAIALETEETSGTISLEDYSGHNQPSLSDRERFYYNEFGFEDVDEQVALGILTQEESDKYKAKIIEDNKFLYEKAQSWDEDLAEDWPVLPEYNEHFPTATKTWVDTGRLNVMGNPIRKEVFGYFSEKDQKPLILNVKDKEINTAFDEGLITEEQREKIFKQRDIAKREWEETWPASRWSRRREGGFNISELEQDIYRPAIEKLKAEGFSVEKENYSFRVIDDKTGKTIMQYWPDGWHDEYDNKDKHDIYYEKDLPDKGYYDKYDNREERIWTQGAVQRSDLYGRVRGGYDDNGIYYEKTIAVPTITSEDEIEAAKRDVSKDFVKIAKRARRNSRKNFLRYEDQTWRGVVLGGAITAGDVLLRWTGKAASGVGFATVGVVYFATAPVRAVWKFFTR